MSPPRPRAAAAGADSERWGALDGHERDEAPRKFPEYSRLGHGVLARLAATGPMAPGGETRAEFVARVVSHGGLLQLLLPICWGTNPATSRARKRRRRAQ